MKNGILTKNREVIENIRRRYKNFRFLNFDINFLARLEAYPTNDRTTVYLSNSAKEAMTRPSRFVVGIREWGCDSGGDCIFSPDGV